MSEHKNFQYAQFDGPDKIFSHENLIYTHSNNDTRNHWLKMLFLETPLIKGD